MFKYQQFKDKCHVTLDGEMTIYSAAELKQQFDAVLAEPRELEINLAGVTEIDSAGIQLLMLIKKSRAIEKRQLSLVDHSSVVLDVIETLGLVPYFGDPVIMSRN